MSSGTKKEALLVFLILASIYAYLYHDPGWNGNSRLSLTFAIVEEGRFTIDSYHLMADTYTRDTAISDGHFYSSKAIGSSLVAAAYYFPIYHLSRLVNINLAVSEVKYILTFLTIGLPSAFAGSLMYILGKQVTGDRFRALLLTLGLNLGTMIFPFSLIFFAHQLVGAILFIVFFLIFQLKNEKLHMRKGWLATIGFLLALAFITEYPVAPVIFILGLYYLWTVWKLPEIKRSLAILLPALGVFLPIAITLFYNTVAFDHPIATGYNHSAVPEFQEQQSQALIGIGWPDPEVMFQMVLHPSLGLFWQSPVLLLAFAGIWQMWRQKDHRAEALLAITSFPALVILFSGFYNWWGGWTFGPRYIVPTLMLLFLPLAFLPRRWFTAFVILAGISIFQMSIVAFSRILTPDDFYKVIDQSPFFAYSSIYSFCLPLLKKGDFANNIGNKFLGLPGWLSVVPLLMLIALLAFLFVKGAGFSLVDNKARAN